MPLYGCMMLTETLMEELKPVVAHESDFNYRDKIIIPETLRNIGRPGVGRRAQNYKLFKKFLLYKWTVFN